jgi:hypothetical protein
MGGTVLIGQASKSPSDSGLHSNARSCLRLAVCIPSPRERDEDWTVQWRAQRSYLLQAHLVQSPKEYLLNFQRT